MNKIASGRLIKLIIFSLCMLFGNPAHSYSSDNSSDNKQERKYDRKFRKNYRKYKTFSPKKKQRIQRLHKSMKGLSPAQKRKLRERILKKKKPNYQQ